MFVPVCPFSFLHHMLSFSKRFWAVLRIGASVSAAEQTADLLANHRAGGLIMLLPLMGTLNRMQSEDYHVCVMI